MTRSGRRGRRGRPRRPTAAFAQRRAAFQRRILLGLVGETRPDEAAAVSSLVVGCRVGIRASTRRGDHEKTHPWRLRRCRIGPGLECRRDHMGPARCEQRVSERRIGPRNRRGAEPRAHQLQREPPAERRGEGRRPVCRALHGFVGRRDRCRSDRLRRGLVRPEQPGQRHDHERDLLCEGRRSHQLPREGRALREVRLRPRRVSGECRERRRPNGHRSAGVRSRRFRWLRRRTTCRA